MATERSINAGGAFIEISSRDAKLQAGLQNAQKHISDFAKNTATILSGMNAGMNIGKAVLSPVVGTVVEFDRQIRAAGAISGATAVQFQKLSDKARDVGQSTAFTAGQAVNDKGENVILTRIASDPVLLVDVLFLVCCFRNGASTVTDDDFAESIVGDVIDDASLALLTGIAEFFPTSRRLPMLKAVEMTRAAMKEYRESMTATLTGESPE